jgi:hypothetical protein
MLRGTVEEKTQRLKAERSRKKGRARKATLANHPIYLGNSSTKLSFLNQHCNKNGGI